MRNLQNYLNTVPKHQLSSATISTLAAIDHLEMHHPVIAQAILQELHAQRTTLKMIASENYTSLSVQLAMGNLLTDKYAEGHPYHRFYAGCSNVDLIESEAANALKALFNAEYAYVQPHSGADANLVAFWAILMHRVQNPLLEQYAPKKLDELTDEEYETIRQELLSQKIMGLSLGSGGHLTHGYRHNVSAKMFIAVSYDVDPETGLLDYDALAAQVEKERPAILLTGYSAYPRRLNFAKMREIADSVGATLMVDMAHFSGLVAGKVFKGEEDPIPYADIVTSTTHKTLRGPRGGFILAKEKYSEVLNKGCPLVLGGPLPHVMAAKLAAFKEALHPNFQQYAQQVVNNARALAAALNEAGAKVHTGGTDNHMVLVDSTSFGLTGRQAESVLNSVGITLNRNSLPFDENGPWYTSGIRLGTPALTSRGLKEKEMEKIAKLIVAVLDETVVAMTKSGAPSKAKYILSESSLKRYQEEVQNILLDFPLYPELLLCEDPTPCSA